MRLGAIFPQTEIGADPAGVRDFAQAAESLGYEHLLVFDHVLGADASKRDNWAGFYDHNDMFHEPFVLFGYLAGLTKNIEFTTGVLILGQRQTALVAKQAAEVDVLTGGRLRLGIGVGWNSVEYEALGEDFHHRGRRCAEQMRLMRALWTEEVVSFKGRYHEVTYAGINPLPVQRPIPYLDRRRYRPGSAPYWPPQRWLVSSVPARQSRSRAHRTNAAVRQGGWPGPHVRRD